jgi:hypothetical protein
MPQSEIVLPPDSTGKSLHTLERTVTGPGVVQDQYVIPVSERVHSGIYLSHTGAHVVQATAQNGTGTGFWWLYNTSSTVIVALRRVSFSSQLGSALVAVTSPRILLQAFTFTGTPAGTAITPRKTDTGFPASTASLRSTQVTSVVTLTQAFWSFLPTASATAVAYNPATFMAFDPDEESGEILLRQNEGVVCWQPDAGTASDTRRFVTNLCWDEFTIP